MITPVLERVHLSRQRRRRGDVPVRLVVTADWIDFLTARGYLDASAAAPKDKAKVTQALAAMISDTVLEGA